MEFSRNVLQKIVEKAMEVANAAAKEVENGHMMLGPCAAAIIAEALSNESETRHALLGGE